MADAVMTLAHHGCACQAGDADAGFGCHHPRKRMIQYAVLFAFYRTSAITGYPLSGYDDCAWRIPCSKICNRDRPFCLLRFGATGRMLLADPSRIPRGVATDVRLAIRFRLAPRRRSLTLR